MLAKGQLSIENVTRLFLSVLVCYLIYGVGCALYNIYLHPLAKFPGPKLRAGFYFPYYFDRFTGDYIDGWRKLHDTYGETVRIAPHILSTISAGAWKDIYGKGKELSRDWAYYTDPDPETHIASKSYANTNASDENHPRMRRCLNHAFSEQALRSQEGIITGYVLRMIEKLHEQARVEAPIDVTLWMNATTFDITGDLAFAEPFGALEANGNHSFIEDTFAKLKWISLMAPLRAYPVIGVPMFALMTRLPFLEHARKKHYAYLFEKLEKRLEAGSERKDFIGHILSHSSEKGMTPGELRLTSALLILAGSETSATCLSAALFHLAKSPEWTNRLLNELKAAFKQDSEMTFQSLSQLPILTAILQESLRIYPPLPIDLPRMTPPQGATVCGTYIPPHTRISIPMYPAYHSRTNFTDPDTFAPQRWLGDKRYKDDKRAVLQPFSMGSRNCIGQSLAWAEMRSVLARVVWGFEMELLPECWEWDRGQKVFMLWAKPPLMVKLKARESFKG